jgi:transglutaminase-like putative cysteine protease
MTRIYNISIRLLILSIFAFPPNGFGQRFEEIKKQFPEDHAVVLANKLHYDISIVEGKPHIESEEIEQIEFLTPDASKYMSSYGFYHSDFQQVVAYDAFTRTANDKKLKVTEFKTRSSKEDFVFYDDSKETTFNFPSIEEGAIGNLRVSRLNTNPYLLSPFFFGRGIPVLNSELSISFPKEMIIRYRLMGMDSSQISFKQESNRKTNTYTFSYKNCPAIQRYEDAPGSAWFAAHVIFFIDSYTDENGNNVRMLSNLDDLYALSYGYLKNINSAIPDEVQKIVDSITQKSSDPEYKARKIYSWVQHHIKYVAFEQGMEGFIPRDAKVVCDRRFGDCKDMASIITEMMRAAGIQAYFTWIGSRDLPYSFTTLPLPLVSNHMICTIRLKDQYIFLDGTDPTCIFGFPSAAIQDKEALLAISDKEYKVLKVPVIDKSRNVLVDSTWVELTPTGIHGRIRKDLSGYFAMHVHGKLMYTSQSDLKQELKNEFSRGSNKFQLDSFRIGDLSDPGRVELTGWFSLPDYAKKLGDEWFLNLNLFKFYTDDEIDYPKRKMPISYNFTSTRKFITLIKIPDGYLLDYLPPSKSYHNDVWGFDIHYEQKGNWLILTQQFDDDHLMLSNNQFEAWNKVLENLYPMYKETLSITKTTTK